MRVYYKTQDMGYGLVHPKYIADVLLASRDAFRKADRVSQISLSEGKLKRVIVVGGLHGSEPRFALTSFTRPNNSS